MGDDQQNASGVKVLFLHNIMAPYRLPVFRELSQRFDLKVFFVKVTDQSRRWEIPSEELTFNYSICRGPSMGKAKIPLNLCRELAKRKYEVVIAGETFTETIPSNLILMFYRYLTGSRLVLMTEYFELENWLQRDRPFKRFLRAAFRAYLKFLYRRCDAFVACSSKAAEHLRGMGVAEDKIFPSPQAVFDTRLLSRTPEQRTERGKVIFLTVAYLSDRKGIDLLVEAFISLNDPAAKLIIAGDGEIRDKLHSMAAGHQNIAFAGHVDGAEKSALYQESDVFVLPSLLETWGLVVNEAMHYGLPVIVTDAMGSADLVDGNGMVVAAGDAGALAQALKKLASSSDLRKTMGQRSLEIISTVDLNAVTVPFIDAVNHALTIQRS